MWINQSAFKSGHISVFLYNCCESKKCSTSIFYNCPTLAMLASLTCHTNLHSSPPFTKPFSDLHVNIWLTDLALAQSHNAESSFDKSLDSHFCICCGMLWAILQQRWVAACFFSAKFSCGLTLNERESIFNNENMHDQAESIRGHFSKPNSC